MPAGTNFLRSILDSPSGGVALLRRVDESLFIEEEQAAYRFVRGYLDRYGELPNPDITAQEGHILPPLRRAGTPDYYYDTLRKRFGYTEVSNRHAAFVESMRSQDVEGMLRLLREMVQVAAGACESERYTLLAEEAAGILRDYEYAKRHPGLRGLPTGWPTLDLATNGMQGGDLIVVVGRPSMGKSYMLMHMADHVNRHGIAVGVMSMEMGVSQITRRWMGLRTGANPNLIRSGELGTYAEERLYAEARLLQTDAPVHLLAGDMRKNVAGVESMIVEFNPGVVFVDAAYLMSPSGRKQGYVSRWESISEVVRELKAMALRYNIPVVISVQFNRNLKSRSNRDADLGDIAGSDSIPQDASIVLGIYQGQSPYEESRRVIDIMKNREGFASKFATAFSFQPVYFGEVEMVDEYEGSRHRELDAWNE